MSLFRNRVMVRPTLIVGLGGTGVLISEWLQHYIRELLGHIPRFVRFLNLDSDIVEQGAARPPNANESDFINLLDHMDMGAVVRDVKKHGRWVLHPHLAWLRDFPLDSSFADRGCQGIPRLGRVVFSELREKVIQKAVAARLGELRGSSQEATIDDTFEVSTDGAPAIHIASSVCGGTGAGMLIDMAYNLRWWSRDAFPRSAEIIGHLMLPEAFHVDQELVPKLKAVAGATLEQIEYLSDPRRDSIQVRYRETSRRHTFGELDAPFNFIYLVNGHGDTASGDRKHLVRMVAQAMRAMIVEPTGQHVTSDANNKLTDILGLRDQANRRRRCFATYGLWCGTPSARRANIDGWIASAVEAMESGAADAHPHYAARVRDELRRLLDDGMPDPAQVADREACLTKFPAVRPDPNNPKRTAALVKKALASYLDHAIEKPRRDRDKRGRAAEAAAEELARDKGLLAQELRAAADAEFARDEAHPDLLLAVDAMIEEDVFNDGQPYGHVRTCLDAWCDELKRWSDNARAAQELTREQALRKIKSDASAGLDRLWREKNPGACQPADIRRVVAEAAEAENWDPLVAVFLMENCLESVKQTLKVLNQRRRALKAAAKTSRDRAAGLAGNGSATTRSLFSTPLYVATDPTRSQQDDTLRDRFRQDLVLPILRAAVLNITDAKAADKQATVKSVGQRVRDAIDELRDQIDDIIKELDDKKIKKFHAPVSADEEISRHPYFEPITKVHRLAMPKVDLAQNGVYADPLETSIAQQVEGTCVPELLAHQAGANLREALVRDTYEEKTKTWFQLLRLRYGFSLQAISTYDDYELAAEEYVYERGFTYSDLWLEDEWYNDYRRKIKEWQENREEDEQVAVNVDRTDHDALLERIRALRPWPGKAMLILREATKQNMGGDTDMLMKMTERIQEARSKIQSVFADHLRIHRPSVADRIRKRCGEVLADLHAGFFELIEPWSDDDPRKARMREALGRFKSAVDAGP